MLYFRKCVIIIEGEQTTMQFILVSSCLLGKAVRYNGGDKRCDHAILQRWMREGRVIPVCPEVEGGLPIPRPPAEISGGAGGNEALTGTARVVDRNGQDVSAQFIAGAESSLRRARLKNIRIAVLKEGSPSCGTSYSYDGTFTSTRVPYPGVTAALLRQAGIHVFSENQLEEAEQVLLQLEAANQD
jgi:uncharacterized protein YbbK (DUF523 family)